LVKHVMSDGQYKMYKKIHKYEYALDEEEGKVVREKGKYVKVKKKADKKLQHALHDLVQTEDLDDPDEQPGIEEELDAERELKNATVHKKRLRDLEQREG
jgi:hypothetical protein